MSVRWQRFINMRSLLIVSIMLLIAFFLQLRQGYFAGDRHHEVYEQYRLIVDAACDISQSACSASREGIHVLLALQDRPSALKAFPVQVQIDGVQNPQHIDVRLIFSMQAMDMGDLQQKLQFNTETGAWSGMVILPICTSGRSDWLARVEVIAQKKIYTADYGFTLVK